eukprot:CAMPEP_0183581246 /NCGR_PEP_ID=MMETSP0371-20130417/147297_1 /TAXON_ID=268820 /ORGANISM="Peridinium aciculiferum, Strain PAER-2" /LENGTH=38 /DNA_ID= /DNA_START= /DNA_END= /DNA_ORIENTATION=
MTGKGPWGVGEKPVEDQNVATFRALVRRDCDFGDKHFR